MSLKATISLYYWSYMAGLRSLFARLGLMSVQDSIEVSSLRNLCLWSWLCDIRRDDSVNSLRADPILILCEINRGKPMHHRLLKHRAGSNAETVENYVFSNLDYRRLQICRSAAPPTQQWFTDLKLLLFWVQVFAIISRCYICVKRLNLCSRTKGTTDCGCAQTIEMY